MRASYISGPHLMNTQLQLDDWASGAVFNRFNGFPPREHDLAFAVASPARIPRRGEVLGLPNLPRSRCSSEFSACLAMQGSSTGCPSNGCPGSGTKGPGVGSLLLPSQKPIISFIIPTNSGKSAGLVKNEF